MVLIEIFNTYLLLILLNSFPNLISNLYPIFIPNMLEITGAEMQTRQMDEILNIH